MSDQPQHICCFHVVRTDTYGDHKTEVADCCWCPKYRVAKYTLVPMENHGPRAPKVMQMTTERYVG